MLSNRYKILYQSKRGIELKTFLNNEDNLTELKNTRMFYVVTAKIDKNKVFKIGISERGASASKARLFEYLYMYGSPDPKYEGRGVKVHLIIYNKFNPNVEYSYSAVRKIETAMKRHFKDKAERGQERIGKGVTIDEIFAYLAELNIIDDTEILVKESPRLKEKNQGSNDAVDKIEGHEISRRGIIKFDVKFRETIKYDSNQKSTKTKMLNKSLLYEDIIQLRYGKSTIDKYIKDNL